MAITVQTQATCLLVGAGITTVLSYPLAENSIAVNFIHHTALAATIGGLADWWGVTAIFHKPLGINAPGTDALRKNYGRLTKALADFVSYDLLSAENILQAVKEENFARLLVEYFSNQDNIERFWQTARPFAEHALASLNTEQAEALLRNELPKYIASLHVPDILLTSLQKAVANDSFTGLWQIIVQEGKLILQKQEFKALLIGLSRAAEKEYQQDSFLRSIFVNGEAEQLVPLFIKELEKILDELADAQSDLRRQIDNWLLTKLEEYRHNIAFTNWVNDKLAQFAVHEAVTLKNFLAKQDIAVLQSLLEEKIVQLAHSEIAQKKLDLVLKNFLKQALALKHETIYQLVEKKLLSYDRDELIGSMEIRVGDDLQNIRKCGTYIGGLLGGLLFIVELLAERLCS